MEISICNKNIKSIENTIKTLQQDLQAEFIHNDPPIEANNATFSSELQTANQNLHKKLCKLKQSQHYLPDIQPDDTFIKNLSGTEIPKEVLTILSLGPKFALAPKEPPLLDIATEVEAIIKSDVPEELKKQARGETLYTITRFSKQTKKFNRIDRYLQKAAKKAKEFLKNNRKVMVSNSDKGGVTIISKKEDYYRKIREQLSDLNNFEPIKNDPTEKLQNLINRLLDKMYRAQQISNKLKKSMKTSISIPPRLFGQIKYHKVDHPVRLIVSTINSAAYKMSRILATILRKSFKPKYSVKNSQQFIKLIRGKTIKDGNVRVSYDVVNCFGNIPAELAIEIIERDFNLIEPHTMIPKKQFIQMLRICLSEANYFVFADKFYRQKTGMFMGSSLAPILVERVIEEFVEQAILELKLDPDFWATYVDDHLTSVPKEMPEIILNKLNSFHPKVQFTMELEKENSSIDFLDTTVVKKGDKLITKWYHKPIASNRILNYYSKHPSNMVKNTAKSFIRRVFAVTHSSFHKDIIETITQILVKNNFPSKMVDQLIHEVRSSIHNQHRTNTDKSYPFINQTAFTTINNSNFGDQSTDSIPQAPNSSTIMPTSPPKPRYAGLTYVPELSESLSKLIRKHNPELKLAPRPPDKVGRLFSDMKQKLKIGECSCVVYGIPCKNCIKLYVGETKRRVDTRGDEHKTDVRNKAKNPGKSALVHHVHKTGHLFDFENTEILKKVRTARTLKIHETNQIILQGKKAVNFKKDSEHVSPEFYNLVLNSKKRRCVNPGRRSRLEVNIGHMFNKCDDR